MHVACGCHVNLNMESSCSHGITTTTALRVPIATLSSLTGVFVEVRAPVFGREKNFQTSFILP